MCMCCLGTLICVYVLLRDPDTVARNAYYVVHVRVCVLLGRLEW